MSHTIKLKKGFNINLAGKADKKIAECDQPKTFAIKPTDFLGISRPKVMVNVGDTVKAGTPILYCKTMEDVKYCAPVSGEIVEIKRGTKRKLLEIVILADKEHVYEEHQKYAVSEIPKLEKEVIIETMKASGVWPNIIQRPYGVVANPADTPKSIFISAFDSHPLAPDYDFIFHGQESFLQAGIDVLSKLTSGKLHLSLNGNSELSPVFSHLKNIEIHNIVGKHPAGNVGVQVHHIDPIGKGDLVWTINPQGLAEIGKLFLKGCYDASKTIAVTGSEVNNPQYCQTFTGACINKFIEGNVKSGDVRFISGNVLTGEKIKSDGYMGYYHQQLTVIPEGHHSEFLGWILPTTKKLSLHKAFGLLSSLNSKDTEYVIDTNIKGEKRAFVQTGVFEKVMPMDILPTYLIKAIMAEDYDDMENLGIYEVIEEDIALCEFVDVSKHDLQKVLREGLDLIKNS